MSWNEQVKKLLTRRKLNNIFLVEYFTEPLRVEPFLELSDSQIDEMNQFLNDCEIELKCKKFFAKKIKTHFNTCLICIASTFESVADWHHEFIFFYFSLFSLFIGSEHVRLAKISEIWRPW